MVELPGHNPSPFTVVVADDHKVVRGGICELLRRSGPEFAILAQAGTVAEAVAAVDEHEPQLLILDISMPGGPSIKAIPGLLASHPGLKIVVLTMHADPDYARQALDAGAHGYVIKEADPPDLLRAFRSALLGRKFLHPRLGELQQYIPREDLDPARLSERERQVLKLVARGCTTGQIAETLRLNERIVKSYRSQLALKLHAGSRGELADYARRVGLADVEPVGPAGARAGAGVAPGADQASAGAGATAAAVPGA